MEASNRKLVIGSTRPDFWLNDDGTETPIPYDQCPECGSLSCSSRGKCWLEDPDVRLGGHDNPYPDYGD